MARPPATRVWDLPTRLLHALLVVGVAVAWLSAGEARLLSLHVAAGFVVGASLGLRLLWGLVGTRHARWRALLVPWREVRVHGLALLRGEAPRLLGHNPVAAWAMLGGLGLLALLTLTGLGVQGGEEREGLLAGQLSVTQGIALHQPHALLAWALLGWIGLHLVGVLKESLRTRENLPFSMISGFKRSLPGARSVRLHRGAAIVALGLAVLACVGQLAPEPEGKATLASTVLPNDPEFLSECGDCHLAWHPSLLPARSWITLMAGQADHFGEDLMLDPATAGRIQDFLVRNAAELSPTEAAWRVANLTPQAWTPLRITETPMWIAAHEDLDPDSLQAEPVRSANRCEACHEDAKSGLFRNRAIHDPAPMEDM